VIESSEFECSISLSLLCGETLLISDLSNSSLEDDVKLRFASARLNPSLCTGSSTELIEGFTPKTSECIPCGILIFIPCPCSVAMIPFNSVADVTSDDASSVSSTQISVLSSSSLSVVSALACSLSGDIIG